MDALINFQGEMELFGQAAGRIQTDMERTRMTFACHSFVNHLFAAVSMQTIGEALAAAFGNTYAFHAFWLEAKRTQSAPSKWQEFIDIWSGDGFANWVAAVGNTVNALPQSFASVPVEGMKEAFRISVHYQLRFWDVALDERDW